ncbi:MAG: T9SS type A sorting domain-containing protein [Bacteroidales bacterium]
MKHIVLFFFITVFLSVGMNAQTIIKPTNHHYDRNLRKDISRQDSESTVWSVTFEEATPTWTFGHDQYNFDWEVNDTTPDYGFTNYDFPNGVSPMWLYMGGYVKYYSESGNNFAYIDGISHNLELVNPNHDSVSSWIQFDSIDLSGIEQPQLHFYQNYKKLNSDSCFIEFSTDNGTNWTQIPFNDDVTGNEYGPTFAQLDITTWAANAPDISLRFRWKGQMLDGYVGSGFGYGWQIDDIKIIDPHDCDLVINDPVINFFEYTDYTQPGQEEYYHKSSHFTKIPKSQICDNDADLTFHARITNLGIEQIQAELQLSVYDPGMNMIHQESQSTEMLSIYESDTVDIISDFHFQENSEPGTYSFVYHALPQNDANPENNADTIFVEITEDTYARDNNQFEDTPGFMLSSGANSQNTFLGTDYYFTNSTYIKKIRVFIFDSEELHEKIKAWLLKYNEDNESWDPVYESENLSVDELELPRWVCFDLPEPVHIDVSSGAESYRVAIEFTDGGNYVQLGEDTHVPASRWGMSWMERLDGTIVTDDYNNQYTRANGLGLRLIVSETNNLVYDTVVCGGPVTITAPEGYNEYYWNTQDTTQSIVVEESGAYTYTAISGLDSLINTINVQILPVYEYWDRHVTLCTDDSLFWQGQIIYEAGDYTANYQSVYGCDSMYYISVSEMPSPPEHTVTKIPADGILNPGETGEFLIDDSEDGVIYYITRGNAVEGSESFLGTGDAMSLGSDYPPGNYRITSTNMSCTTIQGMDDYEHLAFTSSTGAPKIVGVLSYGPGFNFFASSHAKQDLYKLETPGNIESSVHHSYSHVSNFGLSEFQNLEPGAYLLSSVIDSTSYNNLQYEFGNTVRKFYYDEALTFENSNQLLVDGNDIVFARLHHPTLYPNTGSNIVYGNVLKDAGNDELNPLENEAVVLYHPHNDDILGVTSTGPSGSYRFENVPEYTDLEVYVTSLDFQNWTSAEFQTESNENYEIDFIAQENTVYPSETGINENTLHGINFSLYPNPANTYIKINKDVSGAKYSIFNSSGQIVTKGTYTDKISVNGLSNGIYYLTIRTGNKLGVRRFSVMK